MRAELVALQEEASRRAREHECTVALKDESLASREAALSELTSRLRALESDRQSAVATLSADASQAEEQALSLRSVLDSTVAQLASVRAAVDVETSSRQAAERRQAEAEDAVAHLRQAVASLEARRDDLETERRTLLSLLDEGKEQRAAMVAADRCSVAQISDLTRLLSEATTLQGEAAHRCKTLEERIVELEAAASEAAAHGEERDAAVEALAAKCAVLADQCSLLKDVEADLERTQREKRAVEQRLLEADASHAAQAAVLKDAFQVSMQALQHELSLLRQESSTRTAESHQEERTMVDRLSEMHAEQLRLVQENTDLRNSALHSAEAITSMRAELVALQEEKGHVEGELERTVFALEEALVRCEELESRVAVQSSEMIISDEALSHAANDVKRLSDHCFSLEREQEALQQQVERAHAELRRAQCDAAASIDALSQDIDTLHRGSPARVRGVQIQTDDAAMDAAVHQSAPHTAAASSEGPLLGTSSTAVDLDLDRVQRMIEACGERVASQFTTVAEEVICRLEMSSPPRRAQAIKDSEDGMLDHPSSPPVAAPLDRDASIVSSELIIKRVSEEVKSLLEARDSDHSRTEALMHDIHFIHEELARAKSHQRLLCSVIREVVSAFGISHEREVEHQEEDAVVVDSAIAYLRQLLQDHVSLKLECRTLSSSLSSLQMGIVTFAEDCSSRLELSRSVMLDCASAWLTAVEKSYCDEVTRVLVDGHGGVSSVGRAAERLLKAQLAADKQSLELLEMRIAADDAQRELSEAAHSGDVEQRLKDSEERFQAVVAHWRGMAEKYETLSVSDKALAQEAQLLLEATQHEYRIAEEKHQTEVQILSNRVRLLSQRCSHEERRNAALHERCVEKEKLLSKHRALHRRSVSQRTTVTSPNVTGVVLLSPSGKDSFLSSASVLSATRQASYASPSVRPHGLQKNASGTSPSYDRRREGDECDDIQGVSPSPEPLISSYQ